MHTISKHLLDGRAALVPYGLQLHSTSFAKAYSPDIAGPRDRQSAALIINADDWGRDTQTTDRIFECVLQGSVSSVSAMVFMADSERAARIALEHNIDAGLHLNLTTPFSLQGASTQLRENQDKLSRYLRRTRLAPAIFNPMLRSSFKIAVQVQIDEFRRLYGRDPDRIDGHHHMHLCANVLLGRLLPAGTIVRRNFSFEPGEKSFINRFYRKLSDRVLARRHRITDFFFSLPPIETPRLEKILALSARFAVEVETHPINRNEFEFLQGHTAA